MKIAMLGHKRIPSREGGIEVVVEELSARMTKLGHQVTCYNRAGNQIDTKRFDGDDPKVYKGICLKTVPTLPLRGLAAVTSSITGAGAAGFGDYDVVHFHAEGPALMCWLPKLFGKRVIVTIHGLDHQRVKWGRFASWYIRQGEKNAVRFADEIIVLSENIKTYFQDLYGRETKLIPNGVNRPEKCKIDLIQREFGLEADEFILYLGRLVPEKGIAYLIQAFRRTKTDKRLVIAGASSDSDAFVRELQAMAEGDPRIFFTGFVQGQMLSELYSNCYIYCLPSDLEGMPLSLMEAMSYGNCCVVSSIDECTEMVADKAVVFRKGDVEELTEVLQKLCDDAETVTSYRKDASAYICEKYNWDDVVERTVHLYRGSN